MNDQEIFGFASELSLIEAIDENQKKLRLQLDPDTNPDEPDATTNEIRIMLDSGEITKDFLGGQLLRQFTSQVSDPSTIPLFHSLISTELSRRALQSGNKEKAWALIAHASYLAGLAEGLSLPSSTVREEFDNRKEAARKGALARNEKFKPAKDEAAKLLRERKPEGGWKSFNAAASAISKDLSDFISKNRISLSSEKIPATLKRWIKKEKILQDAFNETKDPAATLA